MRFLQTPRTLSSSRRASAAEAGGEKEKERSPFQKGSWTSRGVCPENRAKYSLPDSSAMLLLLAPMMMMMCSTAAADRMADGEEARIDEAVD